MENLSLENFKRLKNIKRVLVSQSYIIFFVVFIFSYIFGLNLEAKFTSKFCWFLFFLCLIYLMFLFIYIDVCFREKNKNTLKNEESLFDYYCMTKISYLLVYNGFVAFIAFFTFDLLNFNLSFYSSFCFACLFKSFFYLKSFFDAFVKFKTKGFE